MILKLIYRCITLTILVSLVLSCAENTAEPPQDTPDLTILYTNDEHGWIEETSAADIVINNTGGIRQSLAVGNITKGDAAAQLFF